MFDSWNQTPWRTQTWYFSSWGRCSAILLLRCRDPHRFDILLQSSTRLPLLCRADSGTVWWFCLSWSAGLRWSSYGVRYWWKFHLHSQPVKEILAKFSKSFIVQTLKTNTDCIKYHRLSSKKLMAFLVWNSVMGLYITLDVTNLFSSSSIRALRLSTSALRGRFWILAAFNSFILSNSESCKSLSLPKQKIMKKVSSALVTKFSVYW